MRKSASSQLYLSYFQGQFQCRKRSYAVLMLFSEAAVIALKRVSFIYQVTSENLTMSYHLFARSLPKTDHEISFIFQVTSANLPSGIIHLPGHFRKLTMRYYLFTRSLPKLTTRYHLFTRSPPKTDHNVNVKVKVSHSLIAVGAVEVRVPLYLGHS